MLSKIKQFVEAEDGPTAVEYAVMLALIITVCVVSIQTVGAQVSASFNNQELRSTLSGGN